MNELAQFRLFRTESWPAELVHSLHGALISSVGGTSDYIIHHSSIWWIMYDGKIKIAHIQPEQFIIPIQHRDTDLLFINTSITSYLRLESLMLDLCTHKCLSLTYIHYMRCVCVCVQIRNAASGLCIDSKHGSTGTELRLDSCLKEGAERTWAHEQVTQHFSFRQSILQQTLC